MAFDGFALFQRMCFGWHRDATAIDRHGAIVSLLKDSYLLRKLADGEMAISSDEEVVGRMREVTKDLATGIASIA